MKNQFVILGKESQDQINQIKWYTLSAKMQSGNNRHDNPKTLQVCWVGTVS